MPDFGMNIEIPVVMDMRSADDADLFVTIPTMFAQLFGFPEGKNILYLNTKEVASDSEEIEDKEVISDIIGLQESVKLIFNNFTEENKEVLVFEEIQDKPIESNGKYSLKLNKEQSMELINKLFEDEEFVEWLNDLIDMNSSANPLQQEEAKDIEDLKQEFVSKLENAEEYILELEILINDEFITEFKFNNSVTVEEKTEEISLVFKIEKINEAVEIKIPDKNADSIINFSDLENMGMGLPLAE